MEKWSILSDIVKYVWYNQYPIGHYGLKVKALEGKYETKMYKRLKDGEREVKEISFHPNSERLKQDCMDVFEEAKSDVMYTARHDENSDIGTTYIRTSKMRRQDEMKAEHKAPITEDLYVHTKPLHGTECKILLDFGMSKSFMSKMYCLNFPSLHSLPKLA